MMSGKSSVVIETCAHAGGREKDLQRQVQTAKDQLRDMHTSNESTQAKLFDASQRQGVYILDLSEVHR